VRITGGAFKGRSLSCPKGRVVRPTTDKVRQALFNILASNYVSDWKEVTVLDLFAGTGALGLEAISRGARHCTFIEHNKRVLSHLKKNLQIVPVNSGSIRLLGLDVYSFLERPANPEEQMPFTLVLADPPYGKGHISRLLKAFSKSYKLVSDDALIVIEEKRGALSLLNNGDMYGFEPIKEKGYGDSALFFFRREEMLKDE